MATGRRMNGSGKFIFYDTSFLPREQNRAKDNLSLADIAESGPPEFVIRQQSIIFGKVILQTSDMI